MKEITVSLPTSGGPMILHGFLPDSAPAGRLPAIIIVQEAFGVNPHIRRLCRRVASEGYAVFSPELFHRSGAGLEFGYDEFPRIRPILGGLTNEMILGDMRAAHRHVAGRPDVDPARIATWGFCLGGWVSVLAACELPIAAAVSFYGGGMVNPRPGIAFTPLMDRLASVRCPLLLVYGGQDQGIPPADIEAVRSRLSSLGKSHEVEVYPEGATGSSARTAPRTTAPPRRRHGPERPPGSDASSADPRRTGVQAPPGARRRRARRHRPASGGDELPRGVQALVLHEILVEEQVEGPLERDAHLLLESRQLAEVYRAPEPPRDKAGKIDAHDAGDARPVPYRGEQTPGS